MAGPRYRQIADDLRRKIESGEIPQGPRLPTETELMKQYGASRNTVRSAVRLLIAKWFVDTRPGRGTFVSTKPVSFVTTLTGDPATAGGGEGVAFVAEVRGSARKPTISQPEVRVSEASPEIAKALGITPGSHVVSRHQRRWIDDISSSLQTSYYPMELVDRGAKKLGYPQDIQEGTVRYLSDVLNVRQHAYQDSIRVRPANSEEEDFFELPEDGRIPVFELRRTSFEESGNRFRLTITVFAADRNEFTVNVGPIPVVAGPSYPTGSLEGTT